MNREQYLEYVDHFNNRRYNAVTSYFAPDITVDGDQARGTWLVYMLFSKPAVEWVQGRNEAEYVKIDGKWLIKSMKFTRTNASKPELFP